VEGGGLTFVRLAIEICGIRVALKGEAGSGVSEWENWCGGCWVLWPFCVFRCISLVV
jgi:hypothetical protein